MTSRAEWKAHVYQFRGDGVGNGVRVLLLLLADHMDPSCRVSVPRHKLAAALGVSETEIKKRIKIAQDVGVLRSVARGHQGRTAVYEGVGLGE